MREPPTIDTLQLMGTARLPTYFARLCVVGLVLFGGQLTPNLSKAGTTGTTVPFEGVGQSTADSPHNKAVMQARSEALRNATQTLEIPLDNRKLEQVLKNYQSWTGAYRVVETSQENQAVQVKVEVNIDLPRLRKTLAKRNEKKSSTSAISFRMASSPKIDGCAKLNERDLSAKLKSEFGASDSKDATQITLELNCERMGKVQMTHHHAVRVELKARQENREIGTFEHVAFAGDADLAQNAAFENVLTQLTRQLSQNAHHGLELVVLNPWPASRIRQLETVLEQGAMSVQSAQVSGIGPNGAVRLHLIGPTDSQPFSNELLLNELRSLKFATFELDYVETPSPNQIHVRLR